MALASTSWMDSIPGARSAYNYFVERIASFYIVGTRDIPRWEHVTELIADRLQVRPNTELQGQLNRTTDATSTLKAAWSVLEGKIRTIQAQLSGASASGTDGLGNPLFISAAVAVSLVALAASLALFFNYAESHEADIARLVNAAVAAGTMTPAEGAAALRQGNTSLGGGLAILGGGLGLVALGALAIWFLPRRKA